MLKAGKTMSVDRQQGVKDMGRFDEIHTRSLRDPDGFWGEAAALVDWFETWDKILDDSQAPAYRWFSGASLNTCYNALDRHVENGRGNQAALIYDSPVTDQIRSYSYRELRDQVAAFAGALAARGVGKGDRVILYMPMIPEAVIAMLACARLGAIHSVVFGGFAANELATRIDDAKPKVIVSASCGIEPGRVVAYKPLLDAAIEMAGSKPDTCIILQRDMERADLDPARDMSWDDALAGTTPVDCVPVAATDPLYILYTSGTTGQPKGIMCATMAATWLRCHWSYEEHLRRQSRRSMYWAASDVGWVVGHSYIVYAPAVPRLHNGPCYEGKPVGTPDAGAFWRVIAAAQDRHSLYGTDGVPGDPTAGSRRQRFISRYDLSGFRALFLGRRTV